MCLRCDVFLFTCEKAWLHRKEDQVETSSEGKEEPLIKKKKINIHILNSKKVNGYVSFMTLNAYVVTMNRG